MFVQSAPITYVVGYPNVHVVTAAKPNLILKLEHAKYLLAR